MTTLKRHWLLITLLLVLAAALSTAVYRCSHSGSARIGGAGGSLAPADTTTATTSSPWTDPTTIGAIVTALLSAAGVVWKALQKKDVQGVIQGVSDGIKTAETLKDAVYGGVPLMPSEETFAVSIARIMGNLEAPTDLQRALAKDLLAKYTITVKP